MKVLGFKVAKLEITLFMFNCAFLIMCLTFIYLLGWYLWILFFGSSITQFEETERIKGILDTLKLKWICLPLLAILVALTWCTLSKMNSDKEQRVSALSKGVMVVLILLPIWLILLVLIPCLDGAITLFIMLIVDSIAMTVSIGAYIRKLKASSPKIKVR